jgi:hypothetical protein
MKYANKWSAIRDRTILGIRNVRHNVVRRAAAAKETEIWMVVKFLREVRDGRVLREFTADLKEVPTKNLLDYLRYLIQIGDVARIQSLGAVFATRNDRRPYSATRQDADRIYTRSVWIYGRTHSQNLSLG